MGDNFIPATRPLRDCATWYSGGTPNKSTPGFWNGSIPWISAKSLNTFFVQDSEDRVTDEGARNGTRLVPTDSILFVVRGMSLKSEFRMGIARRPVTFNQDLKALVAANDIVPAYLAYAIRAKTTEILGMVGEAGHGTGVLPTDRIQALEVRTPPLPEQRAIAHILGTLDDKIELNRRTNETLEAMARALFKSWFVDFDPVHAKKAGRKPEGMDAETAALFPDDFEDSEMGKIPRGWRVAPVTTMQDGGKYACTAGPFGSNLTSRDYVDFGIPVIRGGNLSGPSLWLTNDAFVFVSLEKARQLSSNTAHPGDVIFTQRGTLGQVAIIPPDGRRVK